VAVKVDTALPSNFIQPLWSAGCAPVFTSPYEVPPDSVPIVSQVGAASVPVFICRVLAVVLKIIKPFAGLVNASLSVAVTREGINPLFGLSCAIATVANNILKNRIDFFMIFGILKILIS
jgi:hypothetical protein